MASSKKKPAKQIDIDPEDEVIEIEEGDEVDDIALVDDLDPDLDPDTDRNRMDVDVDVEAKMMVSSRDGRDNISATPILLTWRGS